MVEPVAGGVDSHTHLNHPRLLRRLDQVLARACQAGVTQMLVVGWDLASSEQAVALAEERRGLWAAVGVHPHDASQLGDVTLARLRALAGSRRVAAIGEVGLDFYRNLSPRDVQEQAFVRQLALARDLGLPVVVHCRQAQERLLAVLEVEAAGLQVVWHCFDGGQEHARRALALGAALGFAGTVTYQSAEGLRQVAAAVPEDHLLVETDCPYLIPGPRRSGDNEPSNLCRIADCVAVARGTSAEQVIAISAANARRIFALEEAEPGG